MTQAREQELMDAIAKEMPGMRIERISVVKNGTNMAGFVLRPDRGNMCPTFYFKKLETAVSRYGIGAVAKQIAGMCTENALSELPVDIREYNTVKKLLTVSTVNAEKWETALKDMPHKIVCDLAIICTVFVRSGKDIYSVNVTNGLADAWGVSGDKLLKAAIKNSPKVSIPIINTLSGMMCDISGNEFAETPGAYVVTNKDCMNGFSSIFYPGMQDTIKAVAGEYYILPSSRHEAMIVSATLGDPNSLLKMVTSINQAEVSDDDFLSNNVYWFGEDGELKAYR